MLSKFQKMPRETRTASFSMDRNFSIYLDFLRFAAALVVLISHFAYRRYTDGDLAILREMNIGSDAVILFFVLSGFVICYTSNKTRRSLGDYAKARMARLYSVVIPALLITIFADTVGRMLDPDIYDSWWANDDNWLMQGFRMLTFSSQLWFQDYRIGTNAAFWSVVYECWYYVAFAAAFYLRGWQRVGALIFVATLVGPRIILLAPAWGAGLWLYYRITSLRDTPLPLARALCLTIGPWLLYAAAQYYEFPALLHEHTYALLPIEKPTETLAFSENFVWHTLLALLFATHFLGMAQLCQFMTACPAKLEAPIRWLAGGTFSLYLYHLPLMQLFSVVPGYDRTYLPHQLGLLTATLVICYICAQYTERRLAQWRNMTNRTFDFISDKWRAAMPQKKRHIVPNT